MVNAIVFGVYGQTQKHIANSDHLSSHFIAGALAGIAQSPICGPIELAKTRMQLQELGTRFSGPIHCLKHTYQHEGYRGVFKGLGVTFLREMPSFGVYFLTYEAMTRMSGNDRSYFHAIHVTSRRTRWHRFLGNFVSPRRGKVPNPGRQQSLCRDVRLSEAIGKNRRLHVSVQRFEFDDPSSVPYKCCDLHGGHVDVQTAGARGGRSVESGLQT